MSYIALIVLLFMSFKYINKGVISFISVLQPFIIAFVFAYLLNTPWKWTISTLESFKFFKKHTILNKIVSTFVVYIIAISAVVGLIIFIVPQLSDSIILVLGDLPDLLKGLESSLKEFLEARLKKSEHKKLCTILRIRALQTESARFFLPMTDITICLLPHRTQHSRLKEKAFQAVFRQERL